jgi:hypothetical protein
MSKIRKKNIAKKHHLRKVEKLKKSNSNHHSLHPIIIDCPRFPLTQPKQFKIPPKKEEKIEEKKKFSHKCYRRLSPALTSAATVSNRIFLLQSTVHFCTPP